VLAEVLWRIQREHVEQALDALDVRPATEFGPSTDYDLLARGRAYPPKAVLGVAAGFALGQQLVPDDFSGGEDSTCFAVLRDRGYVIEPKPPLPSASAGARTWIFQGNPDTFDMDAYLARAPERISWTVSRYREQVQVGDHVYLWRAAGQKTKAVAGIVARCTVVSAPWRGADETPSRDLWRSEPASPDTWHVWLHVDRIANAKQVIKRDWLKDDPICSELLIVTRPVGTNHPVPPAGAARLRRLWERTGVDWTRPDSIAGLWAYEATYGHEVSKSAGGPVAEVALRIGRAVDGVYNKVMNFRSLDPRDDRTGLRAGGEVDEGVWNEFYDTGSRTLRSAALDAAFLDLWGDTVAGTRPNDRPSDATLPPPPPPSATTSRAAQTTFRVVRDSAITRWVKDAHEHRCQACGQRFDSPKGPVAEGAHIQPLGAEHGGPDDVRNVLCLCPTHHALFDRGAFVVADDLTLRPGIVTGLLQNLVTKPVHQVEVEFLRYHRTTVARWRDGA
jgi:hypothetical protein